MTSIESLRIHRLCFKFGLTFTQAALISPLAWGGSSND